MELFGEEILPYACSFMHLFITIQESPVDADEGRGCAAMAFGEDRAQEGTSGLHKPRRNDRIDGAVDSYGTLRDFPRRAGSPP